MTLLPLKITLILVLMSYMSQKQCGLSKKINLTAISITLYCSLSQGWILKVAVSLRYM